MFMISPLSTSFKHNFLVKSPWKSTISTRQRHVAKQNGPLVRGRCFGAVHQRRGCGEGQTEAWRRSDVELQRCKQIEDVYIYIYICIIIYIYKKYTLYTCIQLQMACTIYIYMIIYVIYIYIYIIICTMCVCMEHDLYKMLYIHV